MSKRIALLNPNANRDTTARMTAIAQKQASAGFVFEGVTAKAGPPIIMDEQSLEAAALLAIEQGLELVGQGYCGILISGFGDPGLDRLRRQLSIPVTGIAEAGMREAAAAAQRFSIVTTTPHLRAAIIRRAVRLGHGNSLASVRITPGDTEAVMAVPERLQAALLELCHQAISHDGAEAILVGGGPLAAAAVAIADAVPVPLIEPVSAGARLACRRSSPDQLMPVRQHG